MLPTSLVRTLHKRAASDRTNRYPLPPSQTCYRFPFVLTRPRSETLTLWRGFTIPGVSMRSVQIPRVHVHCKIPKTRFQDNACAHSAVSYIFSSHDVLPFLSPSSSNKALNPLNKSIFRSSKCSNPTLTLSNLVSTLLSLIALHSIKLSTPPSDVA